jgi:hypothetical protein
MEMPLTLLLRDADEQEEATSNYLPLSSMFPRLETLSLIGDLAKMDSSFSSILPTQIARLRLISKTSCLVAVENLPQSLTDLRLERIYNPNRTEATIMPQSLRHFVGEIYIGHGTVLPPTLTHLDATLDASVTGTRFPQLPPSIHKLSLSLGQYLRFTINDGNHLPTSLTDLDLSLMEEIPSDALNHLPASLRRLILPPGDHLTDESIKTLPRGLIHLDMNYQSELTPDAVKYLPENLESLWMSLVGLDDDEIKQLPRSLKRLSMLNIEQHSSRYLPPKLESLKVFRARLDTSWTTAKFPNTIKSLNFALADKFDTLCLPRELLELDASAECFSDRSSANLPRTLTSLNLRTFNEKLTDEFFARLDCPSLTSLGCHSVEGKLITDKCIEYLPPTLTSLSLNLPNITGACAKVLPRILRSLQLQQSSLWRNEDLASLPRSIRFLHLPRCTSLTNDCLKQLPPHLLTFENGSGLDFQNIPFVRHCEADMW